MLSSFKFLGCNMSNKVLYLHSHLDCLPENFRDTCEEQGERFHQDIETMEERYEGRYDMLMMVDYCWCFKKNCSKMHLRTSRKRSFGSVH